jgi:amino acid transporter
MQRIELRHNALSKLDALLIAVAGTAPANSLAVSTAALVGAVGLFGPGAILFGAISMFGIAVAYYYLNVWRSDAGAAYAWVGRSLNPMLGFFAGWSPLVANMVYMVAGSLPAASATLDLVNPSLTNNGLAVTVVGAVWFVFIAIIVLAGIRTTAKVQKIVTAIEIAGILILAFAGIVHGMKVHSAFSVQWLSPLGPGTLREFMAGALVALFYFWGWDVSSNLSEETVDRNRTPGMGGIGGMVVILALFVVTQISIQMTLTPQQIVDANANVLVAFANAILPRPWGDIAILVVIISTVGTLETSLLAVSRTMMSMGRDRVIDPRFAELHPKFETPWFGSILFAALALLLFAAAAVSSGLSATLNQSVNAIGILIAVYFGLSGFASAWYYRRLYASDKRALWLRGIWPAASGAFLFVVAIDQIVDAGLKGSAVTLGLLAAGLVPMLYYRRKYASVFYTEPMEAYAGVGRPSGAAVESV